MLESLGDIGRTIQEDHPKLEIIIVGAGVAGLTLAYTLRDHPNISIKIYEKRTETESQPSYPIHLSSQGRQILSTLFTPESHTTNLYETLQKEIPVRYDGITVLNEKGRKIWKTIQEVGVRPVIQRSDLCTVLKSGLRVGAVEFGNGVKSFKEVEKGFQVVLGDESIVSCDVVVGADGMFSSTRSALYPDLGNIGLGPLPWQTINLRSASPVIAASLKDPYGVNMIIGNSYSAVLVPLTHSNPTKNNKPPLTHISLTIPLSSLPTMEAISNLDRKRPNSFIQSMLTDPALRDARSFPLHSATKTITGKGHCILIGDAAHGMVPFCGAGASAGIKDGYELGISLMRCIDKGHDFDEVMEAFNRGMRERNDVLINQSRRLLWLSQGDVGWKRVVRRLVFGLLEIKEVIGGRRKVLEGVLKEMIQVEGQDSRRLNPTPEARIIETSPALKSR